MSNTNHAGGMGFLSTLAIVFIVLKLTGVINWSWLWILSPLWISLVFLAVALVIFVGVNILRGV